MVYIGQIKTRLTRLKQDEDGVLSPFDQKDARYVSGNANILGALTTIVLQNPVLDFTERIEELAREGRICVPEMANAFAASEFNPDAQFIKGGKACSCYALQFYYSFPPWAD